MADRLTPEGYRKSYPKPEAEKLALREAVRGMNADVLALEEMGDRPFLAELQRDLRAEGERYDHAALLNGPDPDRHVAVLSRRPFKRVQPHANISFDYQGRRERVKRGMLEVAFDVPGGELTVFIVHLKSRLTENSDDPQSSVRRTKEARAVRQLILNRFPDPSRARFVLLGDLNDTPESKPVKLLMHRGSTVIVRMLPTADRREEMWTHYYKREHSYSRIDYALVSPALLVCAAASAIVYDGPGVRAASDHRPVLLTLDFGFRK